MAIIEVVVLSQYPDIMAHVSLLNCLRVYLILLVAHDQWRVLKGGRWVGQQEANSQSHSSATLLSKN